MPTPIGHALAGLAVAGLARDASRPNGLHVGLLVACAMAPDLDLILKLFDGVNHHRGPTHSVTAALMIGLIAFALRRWGVSVPSGLSMAAAWMSHVALDFFGVDTSPPAGEMALWPLSLSFYISPISIFYDVPRSFTVAAMIHNMTAVLIELAVMVPIAALCWRTKHSVAQ